nr:iron chelate uptake ABC transporter family permease subunit [Archaeoglobus neptunius]
MLALSVGSAGYDYLFRIISGSADDTAVKIVFEYRLPRLLLAMVAGAALSSSGCAMQALFRNPLAEPYVLGVASGASVGAALSVALGIEGIYSRMGLAFSIALLTAYIVYMIGSASRFRDQTYAILLAGVAMASFFSGVTSLLIYFSTQNMHKVIFWLMGSFSNPFMEEVLFALPVTIAGVIYLIVTSWNLNALLLGDEHASAVGINVERYRRSLIAVVALLTSATVAVSGVIGFVGIIIPHTMRILVGEEHQKLLPSTVLLSTAFMPAIDIITRISTNGELPVGAITAMLGGPFFLYLLLRGSV